ncbi:gas vesicle protein GvpO [Mycobacterium sp. 1164966.3]|uniref:gas vesicle protein GvpO n=1 Tax=Mycobacterium sp. 1164966.3 TaxID=1856861 RepID=UPI0007FCF41E|nr:gas vesicle protein GvpO [Mycobacterium sp. 1164966.3]OBA82137.1 gas vesicle protein GvpO [Mycobacterium sp. 1164966.3]
MPRRARTESQYDRDEPALTAREAVDVVRENITEIAGGEPVRITSVAPSDEGGWIVEVETVEDRRIPSSADMLALYEVELDSDGEMLAYRRLRRYMRGQTDNGGAPE